jgi:hypothetical protein
MSKVCEKGRKKGGEMEGRERRKKEYYDRRTRVPFFALCAGLQAYPIVRVYAGTYY